MVHLRGTNGETQCGRAIASDMLVLGIGGFRVSHSINPKGACLTCLGKSHRLRVVKRPADQIELTPKENAA